MKCTIFKKSIIKNIVLLFTVMLACVIGLHAQDEFNVTRLTFDPAQEGFPTWSPDGKFIFYSYSSRDDSLGKNGLWKMTPDSTGAQQIFAGLAEHPKWSPDGKRIAFTSTRSGNFDVWLMDVDISKVKKELQVLNN